MPNLEESQEPPHIEGAARVSTRDFSGALSLLGSGQIAQEGRNPAKIPVALTPNGNNSLPEDLEILADGTGKLRRLLEGWVGTLAINAVEFPEAKEGDTIARCTVLGDLAVRTAAQESITIPAALKLQKDPKHFGDWHGTLSIWTIEPDAIP